MEPISNPTETDIHTAKPADNEVQALEYNEATIIFDVAKKTVEETGFDTLKSYDPNVKMSVRKNGEYKIYFNNLEMYVCISKGNDTPLYEMKYDQIICTDCPWFENISLPRLEPDTEYIVQAYVKEDGANLTFKKTIKIDKWEDESSRRDYPANKVHYHPGYYPDDEQWERDQPYLEPGEVRPTP